MLLSHMRSQSIEVPQFAKLFIDKKVMISTVVNIIASMTLALNATDPDMRIVYPFFIIGSALAIFTFYRRKLVWPTMLVSYFLCMNILGFGIAMRYW